MSFENKVAVVTGGATGIGCHTALVLAQRGARVAIVDIKQAEAEELAGAHERIDYYFCDLRNLDNLVEVFQTIKVDLHHIDILVNSAGVANRTNVYDITEDEWDSLNDVNLKASFFCAQQAATAMREQGGGGRIVNLSSVRARQADGRHTIYDVTKAGVQAMTRSLAVALANDGINVNTVSPGYVLSPMTAHNLDDANWLSWLSSRVPQGRMIEFQEIVETILFFCSPAASGITGQNIYVDGGWTIHE